MATFSSTSPPVRITELAESSIHEVPSDIMNPYAGSQIICDGPIFKIFSNLLLTDTLLNTKRITRKRKLKKDKIQATIVRFNRHKITLSNAIKVSKGLFSISVFNP